MDLEQSELFKESKKSEEPTTQLPATYVPGYLEDVEQRPNFAVEANFMFLPIFSFDRHLANKKSKVTHTVPVLLNGVVSTSTIAIATSEILVGPETVHPGLPGAYDMQVLFCLMDLWDEQGRREDGLVRFRLTTLAKRLNLSHSGRTFSDLKFSVKKLAVTKLESVSAFFSKDQAKYVNSIFSILENPEFISNRGSRAPDDACQVYLSKFIIKNLLKDFRGIINRRTYQSLEIGFAQRLFSLFQYRSQFQGQRNCVDFELMELATILPMSGKLYPSIIRDRLKNALKELEDREVLKHEYIKAGSKTVLRLTPYTLVREELNSVEAYPRFLALVKEHYKIDLFKKFEFNEETLSALLKKHSKKISFMGRDYIWGIHVLDVLAYMMFAQNYEMRSPQGFLHSMLQKESLDYPIGYKPVDIAFEEVQKKREVEKQVTFKEESVKSAEDELFRLALGYVDNLKPTARARYLEKARATNPLMSEQMAKYDIAELISEDIRNGVAIIDYLNEEMVVTNPKLQIAGPGSA